ncbi:hypothetical protein CCB80_07890 [Armatimonadetes bacterium Uphvl-Ar1]|nr:hypothetical protein CCB80_07890 [Armatimonadetes bacterium Uphvl-Ar1]
MRLEGANVRSLSWEEIDPSTLAGAGEIVTQVRVWHRPWFLSVLFFLCLISLGAVTFFNRRVVDYGVATSYLDSFSRELGTLEGLESSLQLDLILQERMGFQEWEHQIRRADPAVAFSIGNEWTAVRRAALIPEVNGEGLRATDKAVKSGLKRLQLGERQTAQALGSLIIGSGILIVISLILAIGAIRRGGTTLVVQSLGSQEYGGSLKDISARTPFDSETITKAVNNIPAAFVEFESDGRILRWNHQMRVMTGISAEKAVGKNIISVLSWGETTEVAMSTIRRVFSGERIESLEWTMPHSLGEDLCLTAVISPVVDSEGSVRSAAAVVRDITSEKFSRELMVANDIARLAIIKALPDTLLRFDSKLNLTEIHDNSQILPGKAADYRGAAWKEKLGADLTDRVLQGAKEARLTQRPIAFDFLGEVGGQEVALGFRFAVAGPTDLLAVVRDLGDRARVREAENRSEARFRSLIEGSADAIVMVSRDGLILYASPAVKSALGLDPVAVVGQNWIALVHKDDRMGAEREWEEILGSRDHEPFNVQIVSATGPRTAEISVRNLLTDPGVEAVIFNIRDVSERRRLESELTERLAELEEKNAILREAAQRDPLTGSYNYQALQGYLEAICEYAEDGGSFSAVLIDIDGFKEYNAQYGFAAGDELIVQLAGIVEGACREDDIFGRSGAEEFLVILPEADARAAELVVCRIEDRFADLTEQKVGLTSGVVTIDSEKVRPLEVFERLMAKVEENSLYRAA